MTILDVCLSYVVNQVSFNPMELRVTTNLPFQVLFFYVVLVTDTHDY